MTDPEFEVLDELYFVKSYNDLAISLDMEENEVREVLNSLLNKGWIKIFYPIDEELTFDQLQFNLNYKNYHYIATKAGLLAHNGR